jgi:DNA-binding NarL/FixJ family response regulator
MNDLIRVMMIEDHPEYRDVVRLALETATDIELTRNFGTAERALRSLKHRDKREAPDVILLDLNLPGISGLEALHHLRASIPDAKIIVLTQSDREADVLAAIAAGAAGYLLKAATVTQITDGIRTVMQGGASLDAKVAKFLLDTIRTETPKTKSGSMLSERELEVLTLLGEGHLKKEIACHLGISVTTVATHIRHIYEKLNVQNAPAAIAKAFRTGIFPADNER